MQPIRQFLRVTVVTLFIGAACGRRDRDVAAVAGANARFSARDSTRTLQPGDVQIASTDSAVELAIIGDTIVAGLRAKVLDQVRDQTAPSEVTGDGLAARIEKVVKSTVASALSHQLLFPAVDVGDVKSEDGKLVFYARNGSRMRLFESSSAERGIARRSATLTSSDSLLRSKHERLAPDKFRSC